MTDMLWSDRAYVETLEPRQLFSGGLALTVGIVGTSNRVSVSTTQAAQSSPVQAAWVNTAGRVRGTWVYMKTGSSRTWTLLAQLSSSGGSELTTNLRQGRAYAFSVQEVLSNRSVVTSNSAALMVPVPAVPVPAPVVPVVPTGIIYSGPIVITQGGTYQGNWESLDPNTPAVEVDTSEPVTIQDSNITGQGTLILVDGDPADLTVVNTNGYGMNPNVAGQQAGRFLDVERFTSLVVEHDNLQSTTGIYVTGYYGDGAAAQTLTVMYNTAYDIDGRQSDGNGGYQDVEPDNDVQFFQANGLQNIAGAQVAWNQVINAAGASDVEDNINIFNTTGTVASPFEIFNNYIYGAYSVDPAVDDGYTGGGIMVSDQGSQYIAAHDNQVLDTGEYGIAISSGQDNSFYNNIILSDGVLPNGAAVADSNIGAYVWNENGEPDFSNNNAYGNIVGWMSNGQRNDYWLPDVSYSNNNQSVSGTTITPGTVAAQWNVWQSKLAANGVTVGVIA